MNIENRRLEYSKNGLVFLGRLAWTRKLIKIMSILGEDIEK